MPICVALVVIKRKVTGCFEYSFNLYCHLLYCSNMSKVTKPAAALTKPTSRKTVSVRERPKRPQAGAGLNTRLTALIDRKLQEERSRLDVGEAGKLLLESIVNPRGTETTKPVRCRIPDGSGNATYLVHESGSYSWSNGATTSCLAQLVGTSNSAGTKDQVFQITYGAAADDTTATMTSVVEANGGQDSVCAVLLPGIAKMRVVSAWLRVAPVMDDDMTARWTGYNGSVLLRTGAAAYHTNAGIYGGITKQDESAEFTAQLGCTVRRCPTEDYTTFRTQNTNIYTGTGSNNYYNALGPMPMIRGVALSNSVWVFSWGITYEVIGNPITIPVVAEEPAFEPELQQLLATSNAVPFVTEANSFKSLLGKAWGLVKKGIGWVVKNRETLANLYTGKPTATKAK